VKWQGEIMPTLYGRSPQNSYQELLKINNTGAGLASTLAAVQDGTGVNSPLQLSTTQIGLSGALWPTSVGTAGQILVASDSAGTLAWTTPAFASTTSPTFTGLVQSTGYSYTVAAAPAPVAGTVTINLATASEFTMTVTTATTLAFSHTLAANTGQVVYLRITSGTAPTLTASGTDLLGVMYDVTSSSYWVFVIGQAIAV
jgi:hypothetical protein